MPSRPRAHRAKREKRTLAFACRFLLRVTRRCGALNPLAAEGVNAEGEEVVVQPASIDRKDAHEQDHVAPKIQAVQQLTVVFLCTAFRQDQPQAYK